MLNGSNLESGMHSHHHHSHQLHQSAASSGISSSHHLLQHSQISENEQSRIAPPDLSSIAHLKRSESYFMSDELRSEIIRKNLLTLAVPTQEMMIRKLAIPETNL